MTIRFLLLSALIFGGCVHLYAQNLTLQERKRDAFDELESGTLALYFVHALHGKRVSGAQVTIEKGDFRHTAVTDETGRFTFIPAEGDARDGTYRILFQHPEFMEASGPVEVMVGSVFQKMFSVSPAIKLNNLRITLDWNEGPRDLDSNLEKKGSYHVSYRAKKISDDGEAQLDRDDTDGYGPETITVQQMDPVAEYVYYVTDYTNRSTPASTALAWESNATIRVYDSNGLKETIPIRRAKVSGTRWVVFTVKPGEGITVINRIE